MAKSSKKLNQAHDLIMNLVVKYGVHPGALPHFVSTVETSG